MVSLKHEASSRTSLCDLLPHFGGNRHAITQAIPANKWTPGNSVVWNSTALVHSRLLEFGAWYRIKWGLPTIKLEGISWMRLVRGTQTCSPPIILGGKHTGCLFCWQCQKAKNALSTTYWTAGLFGENMPFNLVPCGIYAGLLSEPHGNFETELISFSLPIHYTLLERHVY